MKPLSDRATNIMDKVWSSVDTAETGQAAGAEMRQRFDMRKWNSGCVYVGKYTDPNHAGSFRVVSLLDSVDTEGRRLINCEGIGGEGEPASFHLPGWLNADGSIVIDFSAPPKGGPKDFHGNWDADGIKFTRDGNKWPMVPKSRDDDWNAFKDIIGEEEGMFVKNDVYVFFQELQLSFAEEDEFIDFLKNTWSVTEAENK